MASFGGGVSREGCRLPRLRVKLASREKNIGRYQDLALTRPVTVTKNGRDRTVLERKQTLHGHGLSLRKKW